MVARYRRGGRPWATSRAAPYDAFQNATDAQRTFREIMYLQEMDEHEHIIRLHNVMKADNDRDIYLVFEYIEKNLLEVLEENTVGIDPKRLRYYVYQMIKGVTFCHRSNVIHRDIKPENLLINP